MPLPKTVGLSLGVALDESIKMEAELRDRFMAVAADQHRPAARIVRERIRRFIDESETPNALTAETSRKSRRDENVGHAANAAELSSRRGSNRR